MTPERLQEIEKIFAPNKAVMINMETTTMLVDINAELVTENKRLRGMLSRLAFYPRQPEAGNEKEN